MTEQLERTENREPPAQRGVASPNSERSGERPQRTGGFRRRPPKRRKFCKFCADKDLTIDHKDPDLLKQFITERYKIVPARVTGVCAKHQRALTASIKRARVLALLPFTTLHHD